MSGELQFADLEARIRAEGEVYEGGELLRVTGGRARAVCQLHGNLLTEAEGGLDWMYVCQMAMTHIQEAERAKVQGCAVAVESRHGAVYAREIPADVSHPVPEVST